MTNTWTGSMFALSLCVSLTACGQKATDDHGSVATKTPAAKRCPDPDMRDVNDPCSVAYIKRKPGRLSERDLK